MITRREVLLEGALILMWTTGANCRCEAEVSNKVSTSTCLISDSDLRRIQFDSNETRLYISGNEPMIRNSGDQEFDRALAITLARCGAFFGVGPGFAYYDDSDQINAYSTPRTRIAGTDGTVLFGLRLLRKLMANPISPEVGVAAVCAHEYGHILQFKLGIVAKLRGDRPTARRVELHADFMAGFFAGLRRRERPKFPAHVVITTLSSMGDTLRSANDHHGTPAERRGAVVTGYKAAFEDHRACAEAVQIGINYVATT